MEDEVPVKLRRLEHNCDLGDARRPSSFHMEDLPLEIQPLVMSLLSLKEAAATSIVARNWRKLWTCHPNLCFAGNTDCCCEEDCVKIERAKFIETVNSIIEQHSGIGLNKFSISFSSRNELLDYLDRWICFAAATKTRIIDINLWPKRDSVAPAKKVYNFPLEVLGAQDGPFIQSLSLSGVSIKPHSDMCGFTKLRRLLLHYVQIIGDLSGLLKGCFVLEDLELFSCYGVANLNVELQMDKLKHVLISQVRVHTIGFHVAGLTHFEYKGDAIPIALHGCSKLEKVTLTFKSGTFKQDKNLVCHAFTAIPTIYAVKVLNVHADMKKHEPFSPYQVDRLMTRQIHMFTHLKHLSCEVRIFTDDPNSHGGILQFAHYLDLAPQLEVLKLHMLYHTLRGSSWPGEATGELFSSCAGLRRLKTVHLSGFRCYRPQVELLCGILAKGAALERVTVQMAVTMKCIHSSSLTKFHESYIREWVHYTSERFDKAIDVV